VCFFLFAGGPPRDFSAPKTQISFFFFIAVDFIFFPVTRRAFLHRRNLQTLLSPPIIFIPFQGIFMEAGASSLIFLPLPPDLHLLECLSMLTSLLRGHGLFALYQEESPPRFLFFPLSPWPTAGPKFFFLLLPLILCGLVVFDTLHHDLFLSRVRVSLQIFLFHSSWVARSS